MHACTQNLEKTIDNKALHDTFAQFGKILSCKVATDANGQSKGFGFVHFEADEAAQLAIDKVNGKMIEDKIVYVCTFLKRSDRPASKEVFCNVYIKNLAPEVSEQELKDMVKEFGETASEPYIMKVRVRVCRGGGGIAGEGPRAQQQAG
jgi:polyadenylate-binding protein